VASPFKPGVPEPIQLGTGILAVSSTAPVISRLFTSGAPPQLDRVTSSAPTVLVTNGVSAGDLIVAAFAFESGTATLSLADTSLNTWAQAGTYTRDTNSPSSCAIFYCSAAIAAAANTNTLTVTVTGGSILISGGVQSYTSPGATWTLDKTTGAAATTGNPASGSVTTTSANEVLVSAAYADQSFLAADTANGWVYQYQHLPIGNLQFEGTEDQIVTAIGTFNWTWIQHATGTSSAAIATFAANVSSGVTGTVAQRVGGLTQSASGTETISGTSAQRLGGLRQAASGLVATPVTGTAAQRLGALRQAASGTETISGTATQRLGGLRQVASGTETFSGTAVQRLGGLRQAASGVETMSGTAAQRLGGLRQAASGTETISGTASQRLGGLRQAASGTEKMTGTAAQRLGSLRQAASGSVTFTGTATQRLGGFRQAASGASLAGITGLIAQKLSGLRQVASGTSLGPTISGTILQRLRSFFQSAVGTETIRGAGQQRLGEPTQQATGTSIGGLIPSIAAVLVRSTPIRPVLRQATGVQPALLPTEVEKPVLHASTPADPAIVPAVPLVPVLRG
jgi:hypothetical protein